jgi:hypothetical protein
MRTRLQKSPEEMRVFIAHEIALINDQIDQLRSNVEASVKTPMFESQPPNRVPSPLPQGNGSPVLSK